MPKQVKKEEKLKDLSHDEEDQINNNVSIEIGCVLFFGAGCVASIQVCYNGLCSYHNTARSKGMKQGKFPDAAAAITLDDSAKGGGGFMYSKLTGNSMSCKI